MNYINTNVKYFKITVAPSEVIIFWSLRYYKNIIFIGEIINHLTFDVKKKYFYKYGLFWETIFGPSISWKCKWVLKNFYNKKPSVCFKCSSEINSNNVRKYRMAFIKLNHLCVNYIYIFKQFSILNVLLNWSLKDLKQIIYYKLFQKNKFYLLKKQNLHKLLFSHLLFSTYYIKDFLENINLITILNNNKQHLYYSNISKIKVLNSIKIIQSFIYNRINISTTILSVIPVIPWDLRPFLLDSNKNLYLSPINNIYKEIILINKRLSISNSITFKIYNKIKLQKKIDSLISVKNPKPYNISLSKNLEGKYGFFRYNILGKRVNFSGRSVIIPGSDLNLGDIGLPFYILYNLFKPIIINIFLNNIKIKCFLNNLDNLKHKFILCKIILNIILKNENIIVNRAPTLHRMNLQSMKPYLKENLPIKIYPTIWNSFNADFDGDQMGVFLPLSRSAILESKSKINFNKNLFSLSSGDFLFKFNQNIIFGLYMLNLQYYNFNFKLIFYNYFNLIYYIENNTINNKTLVWVRITLTAKKKKFILICLGKLKNSILLYN